MEKAKKVKKTATKKVKNGETTPPQVMPPAQTMPEYKRQSNESF